MPVDWAAEITEVEPIVIPPGADRATWLAAMELRAANEKLVRCARPPFATGLAERAGADESVTEAESAWREAVGEYQTAFRIAATCGVSVAG